MTGHIGGCCCRICQIFTCLVWLGEKEDVAKVHESYRPVFPPFLFLPSPLFPVLVYIPAIARKLLSSHHQTNHQRFPLLSHLTWKSWVSLKQNHLKIFNIWEKIFGIITITVRITPDPVIKIIRLHDRIHPEASSPHHVNDGVISDKMSSSKGEEERRSRIVQQQF